ncbi:MAG: beta-mannanase [Myxococcaceae bacterium]|nr:beta-mannanase [Myxococcaceae bacterium]
MVLACGLVAESGSGCSSDASTYEERAASLPEVGASTDAATASELADAEIDKTTPAVGGDAGVRTPVQTLMHGFYHGDAPNGPVLNDAVARWLGREPELAVAFQARDSWVNIANPDWQLPPWGKWVAAKPGRKLVYSVALFPGPPDGSGPDTHLGNEDDVSLQQCADGLYNEAYTMLADNLVSAGLSGTILRPGWEFDQNWPAWNAAGKEKLFAGCFRQVVISMRRQQPKAGFTFVWNPTEDVVGATTQQIESAWPGDDYVDYVGIDAYDTSHRDDIYPYPPSCSDACRATHQQNAWNDMSRGMYLMRDLALAHGKPLSVPEWGVWTLANGRAGNDNPFYIGKMYEFFTDPDNRVAFEAYFDFNDEEGPHEISDVSGDTVISGAGHDYVTGFPQAAAKFKALFGGP